MLETKFGGDTLLLTCNNNENTTLEQVARFD